MKYKALVLDHDDTSVKSTPEIHYPAFLKTLELLRPGEKLSRGEFMKYNFDIGFLSMCLDVYHLNEEEMKTEVDIWRDYTNTHIPDFYDGIDEVIRRQKQDGGVFCVVSHSFSDMILRDYKYHGLPTPDMTFGWELEEKLRKPSPYPIEQIMKKYSLLPSEIAVIDDMKPGYDMAKAAGVDFYYAGWSETRMPKTEGFMRENGVTVLSSPLEFSEINK